MVGLFTQPSHVVAHWLGELASNSKTVVSGRDGKAWSWLGRFTESKTNQPRAVYIIHTLLKSINKTFVKNNIIDSINLNFDLIDITDPDDCTSFPCTIFSDTFDYLDLEAWETEITIGGGGVSICLMVKSKQENLNPTYTWLFIN